MLGICLIDDTPHWHGVTRRTVDLFDALAFEGFTDAESALTALAQRDAAQWPRVILMDYFLGRSQGDTVTRRLRGLAHGSLPLVVGHSSVLGCSQAIVMAGGDCVVRKHADNRGRNPSLLQWLSERHDGLIGAGA